MDDHHQVKTSFLFIQLQSASKASGPSCPANIACSDREEEGSSPSLPGDVAPTVHADSEILNLSAPVEAVAVSSEGRTPEHCSQISSNPIGNEAGVSGEFRKWDSLNADRSDLDFDDRRDLAQSPIWVLRQGALTAMNGRDESSSAERLSSAPSSKSISGGSHVNQAPNPGINKEQPAKPLEFVHPGTFQPPAGKDTNDWNPPDRNNSDSIPWKVNVSKQSGVHCGVHRRPESKTFVSAVIERSSKIPGGTDKKTVDRRSLEASMVPQAWVTTSPVAQDLAMTSVYPQSSVSVSPSTFLSPNI